METLRGVCGVVADLDGTLYVGNEALPGVPAALGELRAAGLPMRFLTNTTSKPRSAIAKNLAAMGLSIAEEDVFTAPIVAAEALRARGVTRAHFLLRDDVIAEMEGIESVDADAPAVVVGDLGDGWTTDRLNRALRRLLAGAEFYALAENRVYRRSDGLHLDVGAFVRALEYGSGRKAALLGKPARAFFETATAGWNLDSGGIACVGDDLEGDVGGGQGAGFRGVLVRTGKFREEELRASAIRPDAVIDSFADLPRLIG